MAKFIDDADLSADFETDNYKDNHFELIEHASLQFKWSGVTGTLDGTIDIIALIGNTDTDGTIVKTITIDSAEGSFLIDSNYLASYYKIKYTKNSITAGLLDLDIIHRGI